MTSQDSSGQGAFPLGSTTEGPPAHTSSGAEAEARSLTRLIVLSQLGERDALEELVAAWHPSIYRYVASVLPRAADASEVSQDTWLRVLTALPRLRERDRFRAWLFSIARRSVTDWMRRKYRSVPTQTWSDLEEPESSPAEPEPVDVAALSHGLDRLHVTERDACVLHYLEGLSVDEVAEVTGSPPGTIKSRLHRARRKLRTELKDPRHD